EGTDDLELLVLPHQDLEMQTAMLADWSDVGQLEDIGGVAGVGKPMEQGLVVAVELHYRSTVAAAAAVACTYCAASVADAVAVEPVDTFEVVAVAVCELVVAPVVDDDVVVVVVVVAVVVVELVALVD